MKEYKPINNLKFMYFLKKIHKHENSIEIDTKLCKYLYNMEGDVYKKISETQVNNGIIYTIKQIKNLLGVEKFYEKNNVIYCEINKHCVELKLVVKLIREKNFNYFINDIEIIEETIKDITEDIMCCFIGDYEPV